MSTESTHKKFVIAGAGQMAHYYVGPMLEKMGIDPATITVVDIKQSALDAFGKKFPGVRLTTSIDEALLGGADILMNLVNSPSHLPILKKAVEAGVRHVYSEKPVVPSCDLNEFEDLQLGQTDVVCAYVINYSGAVARLVELMKEKDLYVQNAVVEWGKDRYGNARATAGTVEDEACHGVNLMGYLLCVNEDWSILDDVSVRASVLREPYVDEAVQQAAMEIDSSFVANPPSLSQLHARYDIGRGGFAHLFLRSNFTRPENEREVCLTLGDGNTGKPACKARLLFDLPTETKNQTKDTLQFGPVGKAFEAPEEFRTNKLADMLASFLAYTQGAPLDPRLSNLDCAIHDVRFAAAVLESDQQDGVSVSVQGIVI